jgi:hypothetical protein
VARMQAHPRDASAFPSRLALIAFPFARVLQIAILPTVRINHKQYRGALESASVLRALCASFPAGHEPSVCNEDWVSENECEEGSTGWQACNSG